MIFIKKIVPFLAFEKKSRLWTDGTSDRKTDKRKGTHIETSYRDARTHLKQGLRLEGPESPSPTAVVGTWRHVHSPFYDERIDDGENEDRQEEKEDGRKADGVNPVVVGAASQLGSAVAVVARQKMK